MGAVAPAISAIVVTYNHERYIRQALDSVLSQKTDFPFEVIVSEDRSTDGTAEIVESYVKRDPDKIRFMRSEVNLRDKEVMLRAMRAARGRYITFLDGDDYWVSPDKLQAQYDFMEAHPDSAITYHDVERVTDDGEVIRVMKGLGHRGTIDDLIKGNFLGTCSVMIRRSALPEVPEWVRDMPAGDWPLYFLAARSGFIDHIEGIISRYRIHGESFWATRPMSEQILMGMCMQVEIEAHLGPSYAAQFETSRRYTARHVFATIRNEQRADQAAPSGGPELSPQQVGAAERTNRIRLFEMGIRVSEAEVQRAHAEGRAVDLMGRLQAAEAGRDEAWRHAGNLGNQMAASQTAVAEISARLWDTVEQLRQSEADRHVAVAHGQSLQTALETVECDKQAAEAYGRQLQNALEAAHRQSECDRLAADALGREIEAANRQLETDKQVSEANGRQLEIAEARGQDLQSALERSQRHVRRIRRREKLIGVGLGVVLAALIAVIVHMQWL